MKLSIEDISMADAPITKIDIDSQLCIVAVYCDEIFKVSDKKWFGKTQIIIRNWKNLYVEKYVSDAPFAKGQTFQIDWTKEVETFAFIQEINCSDNALFLNGFSKESGAWLTYQFNNFSYDIEADEIL